MSDDRLETPKQCAERVGGVSEWQIRRLMADGKLAYVPVGGRKLIRVGAFEEFVEKNEVKPWHDEVRGLNSAGSISAGSTTSRGQSAAAAASAQLARLNASKLKSSLRNGSKPDLVPPGRVIPLRSS
jgi:hypothetical protein